MTVRVCQDCAESCDNEATVKVYDEAGGPVFVYCDDHAPMNDPGCLIVRLS